MQILTPQRIGGESRDHSGTTNPALKAAVTNDVLKLIKRDINSSADARRWRDIVFELKQRVGEEKFRRESA
jgi:hypothetical protein